MRQQVDHENALHVGSSERLSVATRGRQPKKKHPPTSPASTKRDLRAETLRGSQTEEEIHESLVIEGQRQLTESERFPHLLHSFTVFFPLQQAPGSFLVADAPRRRASPTLEGPFHLADFGSFSVPVDAVQPAEHDAPPR